MKGIIRITLIGDPDSGMDTLSAFSLRSTGRSGKSAGIQGASRQARNIQNGYQFHLSHLPGIHSLSTVPPQDTIVYKNLMLENPDIVVQIVDSTNLERDLLLTTRLFDMDSKVVIALDRYDDLKRSGNQFDYHALGRMIGIPIIPAISSRGFGIRELYKKVVEVFEDKDPAIRQIHIPYGERVEKSIDRICEQINMCRDQEDHIPSRFWAIRLLEKDEWVAGNPSGWKNFNTIKEIADAEIAILEKAYRATSGSLIADARYGFISGALKETYAGRESVRITTGMIDSFLTHRLFGFPIFFLFMFITFYATFSLGKYPMDWLDRAIAAFSGWLYETMGEGPLKDLLTGGIIGGVGSVIVFLPNILILFFLISLMEDTGYMARAAFIMDKVMHRIGLHGRSFIPLLMGFGCNVPAIMSTRIIENRNNRILTILINPFMSCSARLPVYILLIGAFFPEHPGLILFIIYLTGVMLAALVAVVLKKLIFKTEEVPYVMELPTYRVPSFTSTVGHMWQKGVQYLRKMGGVILVASIIIWALGYYPRNIAYENDYEVLQAGITEQFEKQLEEVGQTSDQIARLTVEKEKLIRSIALQKEAEHREKSYIGRIGFFIEPALRPLGFDWKMGVSLLSGIAAKEIVVSTMGVLYQAGNDPVKDPESLIHKLKHQSYLSGPEKGRSIYNPVVALAFMMFILTYFPCVAVIAAIRREAESWKWAGFTIFYTTALAWLLAFIIHTVGSMFYG